MRRIMQWCSKKLLKRPARRSPSIQRPSRFPSDCWTNISYESTDGVHIMGRLKNRILRAAVALIGMAAAGCSTSKDIQVKESVRGGEAPKISWGMTPDGQMVDVYTLTNAKGAEA